MTDRVSDVLPDGRRGQVLAVALVLLVAAVLWLAVVSPLMGWYQARSDALADRQALLEHMTARVRALPGLRQLARTSRAASAPSGTLLSGDSDAIAAAQLQAVIQDMAATAGAALTSEEVLPTLQQGAFRQIGLRIAVTGRWPTLIGLLQAIDGSDLQLLVDDLQLHAVADASPADATPADGAPGGTSGVGHAPLQASLVVLAFRPAAADRSVDDLHAQANEQ